MKLSHTEDQTFGLKLGKDYFSGISLQAHHDYSEKISDWTHCSFDSGRPWIVTVDEPLGCEFGARLDNDAQNKSLTLLDPMLLDLMTLKQ